MQLLTVDDGGDLGVLALLTCLPASAARLIDVFAAILCLSCVLALKSFDNTECFVSVSNRASRV